jgi:hypothetical protein
MKPNNRVESRALRVRLAKAMRFCSRLTRGVRRQLLVSVPNKIPVRRVMQVLLVLALLVMIVNPELRVLVLLVDSLGLELVLLLLALQLRSTSSLLAPFTQALGALSCNAASQLGSIALRAYQKALVLRRFDRLICPLLIIVSYGLRCRVAIRAA